MIQSLYLHKPIVDTLKCFGDLEEVVNNILAEGANGKFDIMNKPPAPDRKGAGRYNVDIVESNYLELLDTYSPFSPMISLRRLLYWFVENEVYNELDWKPVNNFVDSDRQMFNKKLLNAMSELQKSKQYCKSATLKYKINEIQNSVKELLEQ